ncbi:hypothetical protein FACS1894103_2380 [Campylobacterota bacterium]|nr:hypothetical protein FACS1894103_2380 [Campylobacterota bacterium]
MLTKFANGMFAVAQKRSFQPPKVKLWQTVGINIVANSSIWVFGSGIVAWVIDRAKLTDVLLALFIGIFGMMVALLLAHRYEKG